MVQGRGNEGPWSHMFGYEVGVLTQAVAGPFDPDDNGVITGNRGAPVVTTGSPKILPHSAKPWLEERIMAAPSAIGRYPIAYDHKRRREATDSRYAYATRSSSSTI